MSQVEKELWETYTYYTLHGNPLDPFHITFNALTRLCRKAALFEQGVFEGHLTESDAFVIFTKEARRSDNQPRKNLKAAGSGQPPAIPYGSFLTCLARISERLFPSCTPPEAMQRILMEHIFLHANKREPIPVDDVLADPEVRSLQRFFKDALKQLYDFYCQQSLDSKNALSEVNKSRAKTFEEVGRTNGDTLANRGQSLHKTLGYLEYLQFAKDFGVGGLITMSVMELGDAYLTAITPNTSAGMLDVKRLTFVQFWECLVRWALMANRDRDGSPSEKIKCLFLEMWHHLQESIPQITGHSYNGGLSNTSKGRFIRGCQVLNERFMNLWQRDGRRVYLGPKQRCHRKGDEILNQALATIRGLDMTRTTYINNSQAHEDEPLVEVVGFSQDELAPGLTIQQVNKLLRNRPDLANLLQMELEESTRAVAF